MSLIDQAKAIETRQKIRYQPMPDEEAEVIIAWLKGDVTPTQIEKAIGWGMTKLNFKAIALFRQMILAKKVEHPLVK